MPEGLTQSPFWELVGTFGLTLAFMFHGDAALWIFSIMVFYVCGVPWELRNWRIKREFINDAEKEG